MQDQSVVLRAKKVLWIVFTFQSFFMRMVTVLLILFCALSLAVQVFLCPDGVQKRR